ncbi:hypothetical protein nbrc107697_30870 [Gordonia crocea]|uniref:Mce associated membrane protein n=1 Tax=Gordonia crocea TaxID=589162 RepID=A0A7I9V0S9_9ACTN|nr:hypothetical protein nbrc107697_30870 [Gordonia crocea]
MSEESTSLAEQPTADRTPTRRAAQPVRVAPLRRRAKTRFAPSGDSTGDSAVGSSEDSADGSQKPERDDTGAKRPENRSDFVTVDRVDPRTTLMWLAATLLAVVLIAASALFAVAGARVERRNDLRAEYQAFAEQVTVNLTSLNKTNVDDIRKTLLDKTSGTAYENLQMVTQQIITQIEQHGIQTQGRVLSSAVTLAEPDHGTVLMVLGWTQRIGNNANDVESQVFRWRVEMRRINGVLKLTKFDWVY